MEANLVDSQFQGLACEAKKRSQHNIFATAASMEELGLGGGAKPQTVLAFKTKIFTDNTALVEQSRQRCPTGPLSQV